VTHDGKGILRMSTPLKPSHHSLIAAPEAMPEVLEVTARTPEGEIMGVRHKKYAIEGVQFHPESILTPEGPVLMGNFLKLSSPLR
jgi:anthranilate/para-aminobenzoate synthase component II